MDAKRPGGLYGQASGAPLTKTLYFKEVMMSNNENLNPLLPAQAIEYFNDATGQRKNYLKAVSIRNCLEAIVDVIFVHIAKVVGSSGNWKRKNLNKKIESLKDFFPQTILELIHDIRKTTNKGAHQSGHKDLTSEELHNTLENLTRVCEWVIIAYLKKYGFNTQSWVPTVLSTLHPLYRVRILEDIFSNEMQVLDDKTKLLKYQAEVQDWHQKMVQRMAEGDFSVLNQQQGHQSESKNYEQVLLVIDKLAMAYLKNGDYDRSVMFIENCYKDGAINSCFREQMQEKLEMLQKQFKHLPIAQDIQQTRDNFKKVLPAIKKEEYSLFLTIFMAIVAQDELEKYPEIKNITK